MDEGIVPLRTCTKCQVSKPATNEFFAKSKTGLLRLAYQCKECAKAYAKALRLANPRYAAEVAKRHRDKNVEKVRAADRERNAKRRDYQRAKAAERRRLCPERYREIGQRWRAKNLERVQAREKRYREKNRQRISTYLRNWYLGNREYAITYARMARVLDPEKKRSGSAAWYERNKEQALASARNWRLQNPEKRRIQGQNRRAKKISTGGKLSPGLVGKLFLLQRGRCACCGAKLIRYHLDHIVPLALGGKHEDSNIQLLTPGCNMKKSAKSPEQFARERGLLI